jgi:hypothetical protein
MPHVMKAVVTIAATTTSQVGLAENQNRKYLMVRNRGADSVLIKPDSAHSGTEGFLIASGAVWEPKDVPVNALYVRTSTTTASVDFVEG